MLTRRELLKRSALGGATLSMPRILFGTAPAVAAPSVAGTLAKYRDPMPQLTLAPLIDATGGGSFEIAAKAFEQRLHSQLPGKTPLLGYAAHGAPTAWPGPAIVARKGVPIHVDYVSALPPLSQIPWLNPTTPGVPYGTYDQFTTADDPGRSAQPRMLTHLHGGFVRGKDDGSPASPGQFDGFGNGDTQGVDYPNQQGSAMLWYHDHNMGATRLNVFAGMAAGYLLRDDDDPGDGSNAGTAGVFPAGDSDVPARDPDTLATIGRVPFEIPIVIQDRSLAINPANGVPELLYGASPANLNGPWVGEYFGDIMMVNGRAWPYLEVEPCLYRLRFLNGCNARIVDLNLAGARMWVIGNDGGLIGGTPVSVKDLVMAPAERLDVLVDFGPMAGQMAVLKNSAPPKPVVTPAPSLGQVMAFRVRPAVTSSNAIVLGPRAQPPAVSVTQGPAENLRAKYGAALTNGSPATRAIVLNEVAPMTSSWHLNLNGLDYDAAVTEAPQRGTVEDWAWVNLTGDTHPMHMHLVQFQIVGAFPFNAAAYIAGEGVGPNGGSVPPTGDARTALAKYITGPMVRPPVHETGWKDTVKANPGYITVVRTKFDLPQTVTEGAGNVTYQGADGTDEQYVYHCHIVEHEDNEMMRPFTVK